MSMRLENGEPGLELVLKNPLLLVEARSLPWFGPKLASWGSVAPSNDTQEAD